MKIFDLNNKNYSFLISGGTGLIGSALVEQLKNSAKEITILTRQNKLIGKKDDNVFYIKDLKEIIYQVLKYNPDLLLIPEPETNHVENFNIFRLLCQIF